MLKIKANYWLLLFGCIVSVFDLFAQVVPLMETTNLIQKGQISVAEIKMKQKDAFDTAYIYYEMEAFFLPEDKNNLDLINGIFTSYWDDNMNQIYSDGKKQIYAQGPYKDGLKNGNWVYYYCNGKIMCYGRYKNGLKDGYWINYDHCNRNNLNSHLNDLYYNCVFYGLCDYTFECEIFSFKDGVLNDTVKVGTFDANGIFSLLFYRLESSGEFYYSEGHKMLEGSAKLGEITTYYRNGKICDKVKYAKTNLNVEPIYVRSGPYIRYNPNGTISAKGVFRNDEGIGIWIYNDENGKLNERGEWQSDDGKWGMECNCQ
ncbi:MAG: toxin-antitoxin system YwqK family antitoxin [Bacteroidia bacterium]|jgi:antitoxin component YwqK of YwqJK toxin-antitoxin module